MENSISYLMKYVYNKKWLLLGFLVIFFESITPIIAITYQSRIIDEVFIGKNFDIFYKLLLLYAIFYFAPKVLFTVRRVIFSHITYILQMNLVQSFLEKIYSISNSDFQKQSAGKLLNNIRNDITEACELFVNQILSETVKSVVSVIFLVFAIAKLNLVALILVLLVAIIYYVILGKLGEKTKTLSYEVKKEKGNVSTEIEEIVTTSRVTTAYNHQSWQTSQFENKFDKYYKTIIKEGLFRNKTLYISEPFLYLTKILAILFGGMMIMNGNILVGEFVALYSLVDSFVVELGNLFQQGITHKKLDASVQRIEEITNLPSVEFGEHNFEDNVKSIEFKNVSFSYEPNSDKILNNLDLDFEVGKKIAIVGRSGSGKSTIAQLLIRAYFQNEGEILINNIPIKEYNEEYLEKLQIVFQNPHFIPMSIKENILLNKNYSQDEIEDVCKQMCCHDFIQNTTDKYETIVGERGTNLSGGQRQRIALARALIRNPEVLILDEATSALDFKTEFEVQKNIDELRKGKTTIIIAHRISTIQNSDIIYVMDKGNIASCGTHDELIKNCDIYKELNKIHNIE